MSISKRALATALVAAVAGLSMILAVGAFGSDKGDKDGHGKRHGAAFIKESLAPSQPTDPTFHGVSPGGAPWVLKRGEVRLKADGKLRLRVKGLVIPDPPGEGTPGGVTTISASLFCGADADTTPADTTEQVPISRDGDARIKDKSFDVPDTCLAPVILVHPNGITARYIAVDGWRF
jgi:hypothetical protein